MLDGSSALVQDQVVQLPTAQTWASIWHACRTDELKRNALFKHLSLAVQSSRVVYPREIIPEVDRYIRADKFLHDWLQNHLKCSMSEMKAAEYASYVTLVLSREPKVLDAMGDEQGNPYVLGTAFMLNQKGVETIIVTDEINSTPTRLGMIAACQKLGINHQPRSTFLAQWGF